MIAKLRIAKKLGYKSFKTLLQDLYSRGISSTQIAKRVGCSRITILRYLKKFSIPVKKRGGVNHSRWRKKL